MKRFLPLAALAVALFATSAYSALPEKVVGPGYLAPPRTPYCQAFDRVFSADTVYVLTGLYYVEAGHTLTIEPGTIIKGDKASSGTLIITRDAQLFAEGTQQKPIVFTSYQAPGNRAPGDWGGIVLLGRAPVNKVDPLIEGGLVGGSCTGGAGTYGGNDPHDSSGIIRYVRVEFAGYRFQQDNEINGMTYGGVGDGTIVDHVQVSYSNDDANEWFGGTVNCKYMVDYGTTDDQFDTDFGFRGSVQFGFAYRDPDISDPTGQSNGFESDNDGSSTSTDQPYTKATMCNMTLVGPEHTNADVGGWIGSFEYSAVLRRSTQESIYNSVIMGYPWGMSVRDATTQGWASADSLQCRNLTVQASAHPTGSSSIHDHTAWSGVESWFATGSYNNSTIDGNPSGVMLNDLSSLTAPDPRPKAASPLVGTADYSNPRLAGFVVTNYRGAFPPVTDATLNELWTYYWTNFDPQNTVYSDGLPTGVGDVAPSYNAHLGQNYPNPFNPQTSIDFVVPTAGHVSIEVYDARGAKVRSLVDGVVTAGKHTINFNADGLASGVYFYRLRGNGFNEMKKMVLLK